MVRYLRGGWELGSRMSDVGDIFDIGTLAGHGGLLTDGVFAWPQLLTCYVDRYDLELPADFEERMRSRRWRPPLTVDTDGLVRP